jgi:hypothetical protein
VSPTEPTGGAIAFRLLSAEECSERLQRLEARHARLADLVEVHSRHQSKRRERSVSWWA